MRCIQVGTLHGEAWDKMHEQSRRVYSPEGVAPTIHTMGGGGQEIKIAVRENTRQGYAVAEVGDSINIEQPNSKTRRGRVGKGVAQTLTTQNEQCVIEPFAIDEQNKAIRTDGTVGTLTTDGSSPKHNNRIVEPQERFFKQALETLEENDCQDGDIISAYNKQVNKSGVASTVTTRPEGFKTAILPIQNYRVRKLTPKERFRLMDFDDDDFDNAKWYSEEESARIIKKNNITHGDRIKRGYKKLPDNVRVERMSDSQLYKQAGNSIVVAVLEAIFGQLFYKE